jgi:hypothetical protein
LFFEPKLFTSDLTTKLEEQALLIVRPLLFNLLRMANNQELNTLTSMAVHVIKAQEPLCHVKAVTHGKCR